MQKLDDTFIENWKGHIRRKKHLSSTESWLPEEYAETLVRYVRENPSEVLKAYQNDRETPWCIVLGKGFPDSGFGACDDGNFDAYRTAWIAWLSQRYEE